MSPDRLLVALAGVAGALGVVLSAAAAHREGGGNLDTAARFLLVHAAALLALAALAALQAGHPTVLRLAGLVLAVGLTLFCGDLCARAYAGRALFPFAAPAGGFALIAGWALVAVAALWPAR